MRDPEVAPTVRTIMAETEAVAGRLGIELPISIDQRMAGAEKVGAHKTSMLQDYEAGRPMEIEAVVGAVVELGDRAWRADAGDQGRVWLRQDARRASRPTCGAARFGGRWMNLQNRWFQLVASVIAMIMIANLQYAWTFFVPADADQHGLEAFRHSIRVHPVHPLSDVGPAARRVADRSPRSARLHQRRRVAVRPGVGRPRLRHVAADAVRPLLRRRNGRGLRLQRLDRIGAEVVQGSTRPRGRHHGGGIRRRHCALHPDHLAAHRRTRLPIRRFSPRASFRGSSSSWSRNS